MSAVATPALSVNAIAHRTLEILDAVEDVSTNVAVGDQAAHRTIGFDDNCSTGVCAGDCKKGVVQWTIDTDDRDRIACSHHIGDSKQKPTAEGT